MPLPRERRHCLIYPREHGAWGILLVPLVTGASIGLASGGPPYRLTPLTISVLALFWLRTPVENWAGSITTKARTTSELTLVRNASLILACVSAAALTWLFWEGPNSGLLLLGAVAAAAFAGQALVRHFRRRARTASQMIGAAGLTVTAPAAYYVVTGALNHAAFSIWILNFLFAANQILFVQLRIRGAHAGSGAERIELGYGFFSFQVGLIVLLLVGRAAGLLNWYAAAAFLPVLWRGFAWFVAPFKPLMVHSLGKRELVHAIIFGALVILTFTQAS